MTTLYFTLPDIYQGQGTKIGSSSTILLPKLVQLDLNSLTVNITFHYKNIIPHFQGASATFLQNYPHITIKITAAY